jgi:hypothetical protein
MRLKAINLFLKIALVAGYNLLLTTAAAGYILLLNKSSSWI